MFNLIKSLFCKHEFEDVSGLIRIWASPDDKYPTEYKRIYVCKKCLKKKKIKY